MTPDTSLAIVRPSVTDDHRFGQNLTLTTFRSGSWDGSYADLRSLTLDLSAHYETSSELAPSLATPGSVDTVAGLLGYVEWISGVESRLPGTVVAARMVDDRQRELSFMLVVDDDAFRIVEHPGRARCEVHQAWLDGFAFDSASQDGSHLRINLTHAMSPKVAACLQHIGDPKYLPTNQLVLPIQPEGKRFTPAAWSMLTHLLGPDFRTIAGAIGYQQLCRLLVRVSTQSDQRLSRAGINDLIRRMIGNLHPSPEAPPRRLPSQCWNVSDLLQSQMGWNATLFVPSRASGATDHTMKAAA